MKRKMVLAFVSCILIIITTKLTFIIDRVDGYDRLYSYYVNNFISDTGAKNAVTAIYLNYRLFDTFFETLLLVISVIGIIYFSRHKGDY